MILGSIPGSMIVMGCMQPLKCNEKKRVTVGHLLLFIITHYIILLHSPLLRIVTLSIFTLLIHHYYTLLHWLLLRIFFLQNHFTSLLHHCYIIFTSLLRDCYIIITFTIIT